MDQSPDVSSLARTLADRLSNRRQWLAVAESCTGGLIAKTLTDLPGSSGWFERGLVTYSNLAKQDLLGVPAEIIEKYGAVSRETAEAMAAGLLGEAPVDWALSVTGIAGPGGGSPDKPVGLVWMAWAERKGRCDSAEFRFAGDRGEIRDQATVAALLGLLERMNT
mgnify:CR=1 FL=1